MALTALALPEKNDAAIYLVWGVATSVGWLPYPFEATIGIEARFAYLGLTASIVALFLYVANIDGIIVRAVLRWRTKRSRFTTMSEFFLEANVALQTWQSTPYQPPADSTEDDSAQWVKTYYQNAVQSYPVRQRSWSQRLQCVLIISIWMVGLPEMLGTGISAKLALSFGPTLPTAYLLLDLLILTLAVMFPQVIRRFYYKAIARVHSGTDFPRDISYTAEIQYVHALMAIDSMKCPADYKEEAEKHYTLSEVLYLQDALLRGDWTPFSGRWMIFRDATVMKSIQTLRQATTREENGGSPLEVKLSGCVSKDDLTARNRFLSMVSFCARLDRQMSGKESGSVLTVDSKHLLRAMREKYAEVHPDGKKAQDQMSALTCTHCGTQDMYTLKKDENEVRCFICDKLFRRPNP